MPQSDARPSVLQTDVASLSSYAHNSLYDNGFFMNAPSSLEIRVLPVSFHQTVQPVADKADFVVSPLLAVPEICSSLHRVFLLLIGERHTGRFSVSCFPLFSLSVSLVVAIAERRSLGRLSNSCSDSHAFLWQTALPQRNESKKALNRRNRLETV